MADDYKELVLNDLAESRGLRHTVKAGRLERLLIRQLPLRRLHPNPEDEFCNPSIGANEEIISAYMTQFRTGEKMRNDFYAGTDERLMVTKVSGGGYMILNGHHRWMAANRTGMKKLPVKIVNVIEEDEILSKISSLKGEMCVSFDLDEVLLTDRKGTLADRKLSFPLGLIYPETLRKNAGLLISELHRMGFDVWVYTGNYASQEYINGLFKIHQTKVDGIINGMKSRKTSRMKKAFSEKYKISLHIDQDSIVCVNTRTKEFETFDLNTTPVNWSAQVIEKLKEVQEWFERT